MRQLWVDCYILDASADSGYNVKMSDTPKESPKRYRSIDEFFRSEYVRRVRDPQVLSKVMATAGKMVDKLGKGHPLARKIKRSLDVLSSLRGEDVWNTRNALLLGGALLYVITPVDAVPDPLPLVGLLDDVLVLTSVLAQLRIGKAAGAPLSESAVRNIAAAVPASTPLCCVGVAAVQGSAEVMQALLGIDLPLAARRNTIMYGESPMAVVRTAEGQVRQGAPELLAETAAEEAVLMLPQEWLRSGLVLTDALAEPEIEPLSALVCVSRPGERWQGEPGLPAERLVPVVWAADERAAELAEAADRLRDALHLPRAAHVCITQSRDPHELRELLCRMASPAEPVPQRAGLRGRVASLLARMRPKR